MRIVREILWIRRILRSLRIIRGKGIVASQTPEGVHLSIDESVLEAASSETDSGGMFTISCDTSDEGVCTISVTDTSPAASPTSAGTAWANGYPFDVPAYSAPACAKQATVHVLLDFDLSSYVQEVRAASLGETAQSSSAPSCEIVQLTQLPASTFCHVYYLLGRVLVDADGRGTVSQDHAPGPVRALWHGPFLGLAEDNPLLEG